MQALGSWGRMVPARVSALYRQGVRELGRRVTVSDGSSVTITNTDKLLGADDWTAQVGAGDVVCVPARLRVTGARVDPAVVELRACRTPYPEVSHGTRGR